MFNSIKSRISAGMIAVVSMASVPTMAALSTEEQAVYTNVTTLITDHSGAALLVLTAILGAFIGFKLLKKFVNKAT